MNDRPLRILVLTSSTGAGHDVRAQAFAAWCDKLYAKRVEVRIEQMLEKSSSVLRSGVNFYNWIQKKSPWVHHAFYITVEMLSVLNRRSVSWGRSYYEQVVREFRPHLVFSVHDCLNRGYFQLARKILGEKQVRCATYCGEFSGGFGYSRNWVEPSADLYISRTEPARAWAIHLGMPPERTLVRGYFMHPNDRLQPMDVATRNDFLMRKLGLKAGQFTVFLATGGNGANNHIELLSRLLPHSGYVQAIVICGRNTVAHEAVSEWCKLHPQLTCHVQGFSKEVPELMQVSQAIVTRGGTTTCAKALHYGCPIVFNAIGGIMPQEMLTVRYFREGAAAALIRSPTDFGGLIQEWLSHPESYARLRENLFLLRHEEDPAQTARDLISLAEQAAATEDTVSK